MVELKTEKYQLEERCKKLSDENEKALKSLSKSKKATEVRELMREKEALQRKLTEQHDEFRMQNQTLLQELSKLVTANELLETEIKELNREGDDSQTLTSRFMALKCEKERNEEHLRSKEAEIEAMKKLLAEANHRDDENVVRMSSGEVSFSKSAALPNNEDAELTQVKGEKEDLEAKVSELQKRLEKGYSVYEELKKKAESSERESNVRIEALKVEKDELGKTGEKRKNLLDEMAIQIQKQSDEHVDKVKSLEVKMAEINDENEAKIERINRENGEKVKSFESKIVSLEESIKTLTGEKSDLKENEDKLQEEIEKTRLDLAEIRDERLRIEAEVEKFRKEIADLKESHSSDLNIFESEKKLIVRDLRLQLEIANAQKHEFEESAKALREELGDAREECKIAEKKGASHLKDLKRQLMAEKQRNEKLQEKMKEVSFVEVNNVNATAADDLDRTSISSWSMMSGGGSGSGSGRNESTSTPIPTSNASNQSSSPGASNAENSVVDESSSSSNRMLLAKIAVLQDERLIFEEKVQMLQNSASAMAEELMKKNSLIQHYCMEGRKSVPTTPSSTSFAEEAVKRKQIIMKKMSTLLKDSDEDEVQRMRNMLEETLTKNMHLQKDLENMSMEVVRLSKLAAPSNPSADSEFDHEDGLTRN